MELDWSTVIAEQLRSEGGGPPGGGRQNPVKEFKKIYILRNYKKSEKHNENVVIIF